MCRFWRLGGKTCLLSPAPEKWRGDGAAAYFLSADGRVRRSSSCRSEGVKRFSLNVSCEQRVILLQQSSNTDSCRICLWRRQETSWKRSYRRKTWVKRQLRVISASVENSRAADGTDFLRLESSETDPGLLVSEPIEGVGV